MLANINRSEKARPEPYRPADFIHWRSVETAAEKPLDKDALSRLIKQKLFKAAG